MSVKPTPKAKSTVQTTRKTDTKPEIELNVAMAELNKHLKKMGMLELAMVNPKDCIAQRTNARYMTVETFEQLVANIKSTGALESLPLVYQDEESEKEGKYEIISGHHRIEAAKTAKIETIMVMVIRNITREELVSKQLAHNALVGTDDKGILKQLFDSIQDINLKMASGLSSEIDKVKFDSLNFKVGTFKAFMIAFMPHDIENFDEAMDQFLKDNGVTTDTELRLASMDSHKGFVEAIIKVKKLENIKSNAQALNRLVELARIQLDAKESEGAAVNFDKGTKGKAAGSAGKKELVN